jgi:hypothetical protein
MMLCFAPVIQAEDAAPTPIQRYANTLTTHVNATGFVDYASLKINRADLDAYTAHLASLSPQTFKAMPEPDRIALLINAYNAFTLTAIINNHPIKAGWFASLRFPKNSIRQISNVWSEKKYTLMGAKVSLEQIEHEMLRKDYNEPRLHMAINCASVGCPALLNEPFTGAKLDQQLAAQSRRFMANPIKFKIDHKAKRVHLSLIFDWFGDDFVKFYSPKSGFADQSKTHKAVLNFIALHVSETDAAFLKAGQYSVKWLDYDWALNEQ